MRLKGATYLLLFFLLLSVRCYGLSFTPLVRNYPPRSYEGGNQNWSISQDERGVMYVANNRGLLEYDGNRWKLHQLPSGEVIRSVYATKDGRIYVGSFEEFGYFVRDMYNGLVYHSLKNELEGFTFHNDEVWNIVEHKNLLLFQCFSSYFVYDGSNVTGHVIDQLPLNLFEVRGELYAQLINGGLCTFSNGVFNEICSRSEFNNTDVVAVLPYSSGLLFATGNQGLFVYEKQQLRPLKTDVDQEFRTHSINRAILTKDSSYVLGTLSNGVYAIDRQGALQWKVNADSKLINNTVLGLYCDQENNICVALDNGFAYIQNNLPIYIFDPAIHKLGMIYDIFVQKDETYLASNQGLYKSNGKDDYLSIISGMEEQAWTVKQWGDQLICGHNKGTFDVTNGKREQLSNIKGPSCVRSCVINDEEILIQGTYTYLEIYKKSAAGKWYFSNYIPNFTHVAQNLEVDHLGNIWMEHMHRGIFRVRLDHGMKNAVDVRHYDQFSNANTVSLLKIGGRILFANGRNLYTYEDLMDSIVPYTAMDEIIKKLSHIHQVIPLKDDKYWLITNTEYVLISYNTGKFTKIKEIPFLLFDNPPIENRGNVIYDPIHACYYLCLNGSIARVSEDMRPKYINSVRRGLWVSELSVTEEEDSPKKYLPIVVGNEIESGMKNVRITLSSPNYSNVPYLIRYKLKGLDEKWIEGMPRLTKEFSRLPYGTYCFKAEILNDDGVIESSIELPFTILRPFYLSYWAIGFYVLFSFCLLLLLLYSVHTSTRRKKDRIIRRQLITHAAELEQQEKKIIELERNQLEVDLRFKSKDLSSMTMMNIAHQEFLVSLKEEIQQQRLTGQYTKRFLDKLLASLEQNIASDDENWLMFQSNFDRIHENFFRNLKERYPDLTSSDLRFCALLRLNLPTKDISKLMNISVRGVDAARYRLRKKLNLSAECGLTDFMINFK